MKKDTSLLYSGRNPKAHAGMVNTPVYRTSTVLYPTLKSYYAASAGKAFYPLQKEVDSTDYSYGIAGTPTADALRAALKELDGADACLLFPSGLSAITSVFFALCKAGDHVLIADSVYGPNRRFCEKMLKKFGVEITYYDPLIGGAIASLIRKNTRIVFVESPGSLTFEIQDIPAIAKAAHKKGAAVVMDNSWATPLYFRAFEKGVDIAIQAGTKYISGHSDVMIGVATCTKEYQKTLFSAYKNLGISVSPDDCYLAARGLRTLAVRLERHEQTALTLAKWLKKHKLVSRVLHPALPSHPEHALFKRDFTGSSGLFSIILKKHYSIDALSKMIDNLSYFGIGASWGGYESLILAVDPSNSRSVVPWKAEGSCIRIYAGLEAAEDLQTDLEEGLKRLAKA